MQKKKKGMCDFHVRLGCSAYTVKRENTVFDQVMPLLQG